MGLAWGARSTKTVSYSDARSLQEFPRVRQREGLLEQTIVPFRRLRSRMRQAHRVSKYGQRSWVKGLLGMPQTRARFPEGPAGDHCHEGFGYQNKTSDVACRQDAAAARLPDVQRIG